MSTFKRHLCKRCGYKFKIYWDEIHRDHCESCIEELEKERILDQSIETIYNGLNEQNKKKFKEMPHDDKRVLAMAAWDDDVLSWGKIGVQL